MIWRIKNWTRRMIGNAACALARTHRVNLNRAIYIGPGSAELIWSGEMVGHSIYGAEIALKVDADRISTVFDLKDQPA
jgi:hypothetical protein